MILRFEDVSYRYPGAVDPALRDIDLAFKPGESALIAGASGSGKSTLGRACIGLVPHFHGGDLIGRVLVDGLDTRQHPVYRLFGRVGLVFQNPDAQLFNQTVEAELAYGLESLGLTSAEIERRLAWVSDLMGLRALLSRPPHTLSGGEKQRVVVAAILALRPRLLVLDEPFAHLDADGAMALRSFLAAIRAEGIGLLIIEQRLHEFIAEADRLIVLHRGRVVADGPPRQVLSQEIEAYSLNLPPLVRLFRAQGWPGTPLSLEEALRDCPIMACKEASEQRIVPGRSVSSPAPPLVAMDGVWFSYAGRPVLRGIRLTLTRGECVALVGRNGAGKTTLVKHFNGLLKPERGVVWVLGRDTRMVTVPELARHVGFVWQNPNDQLFQATVRDEVLTGPRELRTYDPEWWETLFRRLGLTPLLGRSPFRLSEGQKKRVAFAAALAIRPELVVLDEPTAGQDELFRRELAALIAEWRSQGRTVVLVTHDLEFAAEHADRWVALADGQIVADGPPAVVMADARAMAMAGLRPTQRFRFAKALALKEHALETALL